MRKATFGDFKAEPNKGTMLQAFSDLKAGGHSRSANSFFIIMAQKLAIATYGTGTPHQRNSGSTADKNNYFFPS